MPILSIIYAVLGVITSILVSIMMIRNGSMANGTWNIVASLGVGICWPVVLGVWIHHIATVKPTIPKGAK